MLMKMEKEGCDLLVEWCENKFCAQSVYLLDI